jgi:hypothetical protein
MSLSALQSRQLAESAITAVLPQLLSLPVVVLSEGDSRIPAAVIPCLDGVVTISEGRALCTVTLRFAPDLARAAAARVFGHADPNEVPAAELKDIVGEICNMLAGRVAAHWISNGKSCLLSPPVVRIEPDYKVDLTPGHEDVCTHWCCAGQWFSLEIKTY